MRFPVIITAIVLVAGVCKAGNLNREQRLVLACHRLDVEEVVGALRDGANVNGRFGDGDGKLFQDPWSRGWPMSTQKWTPFIALANASDYPDPPRKVQHTSADLDWAEEQKSKVTPEQIEQRKRKVLTIAMILLSHRADIDAHDGNGATALYDAVYSRKLDLAKLLLRFNAKVNTKTGVYIDGPGDTTPLHYAFWSVELTKLILQKGADPKAKDTEGKTPLDWARRGNDPAVAKMYQSP